MAIDRRRAINFGFIAGRGIDRIARYLRKRECGVMVASFDLMDH